MTWTPSLIVAGSMLMWSATLSAEPVGVRYAEGTVHGFLVLRTLDGQPIADGDLIQTIRAGRVTSRLVFHFKDGSLHDEAAIFSQRQRFRLLRDHLVQKGPSFPKPMDVLIDAETGNVTVQYSDDHGQPKKAIQHMTFPADLANGVMLSLLKNVDKNNPPKSFGLIAATPKPRLVKLALTAAGQERFSTGGEGRTATHYVLRVDIGGLSGLVAPLVGKQPPDSHVWILDGESPAFIKSEQPFYFGGPVWRIETTCPIWPRSEARTSK